MFTKIFYRVILNKNKLFLITLDKAKKDLRILELWHYRFIHLVDQDYAVLDEKYELHQYAVYSLDYGKLLSLKRDKRGDGLMKMIEQGPVMREMLSRVVSHTLPSILSFCAPNLLDMMINNLLVSKTFKDSLGLQAVKKEGIEAADLTDSDNLVTTCVIDDLL